MPSRIGRCNTRAQRLPGAGPARVLRDAVGRHEKRLRRRSDSDSTDTGPVPPRQRATRAGRAELQRAHRSIDAGPMRKDRSRRRSLTRGLCILAALLAACTPSAEHARERLERSGISVETNSFVQAAAERDVATIRLFVASGLEINRLHSGTGVSPLMAAAGAGRTESVRLLIEKGGSVWQRSRGGETALMFAVHACRSEPTV